MKKSVLRELKKVAEQLPPLYVKGNKVVMKGGRMYLEPELFEQNHYTKLKQAYTKGGNEDVNKYIKSVFLHDENIKKMVQTGPQANTGRR